MKGKGRREGFARWAMASTVLLLAAAFLVCLLLPGPDSAEAEGLTIERIDLKFEDGSVVRVVSEGESLRARAEVTYRGAGLLQGAWEIAEPLTTGGRPSFRKVLAVQVSLAGVGGKETLRSPALPSKTTGLYTLRFAVSAPQLAQSPPELSYFVGGPPSENLLGGRTKVPREFGARGPSAGDPARDDTAFSWDAVPGSVAYQVEIYDKEEKDPVAEKKGPRFNVCLVRAPSGLDRPPTAGIMVPGFQTKVAIGELAGSSLQQGTVYLWRVVAVGKGGKVLCQSPFREFTFSE